VALQAGEAGPFAMGLVQAILTLAGALVFLWRRRRRPAPLFCLGALLLATFMITPLSKPLWDTVPLLETTQFPWRLLSVQAFFAASVTGMLGLRPQAGTQSSVQQVARWVLIGGTLLLPMAATLPSLQPERLLITAEDVTWDALLLYESFTGNIGSTIRHEYLPAAVIPRLYISEAVVDGVNGARPIAEGSVPVDAELVERTPVKQVWRVALDEAAPVAFPLNWWPGWQASIGEAPVTTYPVVGSGRLAVDLEAGEHTVALQLRNTPLRTAAEATSVLATIAGLVAFAAGKQKITFPYRRIRHLALPVVGIALVSIAPPALGLLAPTPEGLRVFDFNQQPFPHAGPSDFGEARLATARPPATIAPGETLSIPLTWTVTGNAPYTATLALVSPAEPRQNVPYTLAKTTFAVQDGITTVQLQLPDTLTRGLYLLELRVFGPAGELNARAAQGTGLGTLFIGAVRAPEGPALDAQAPVLGTFRDLTLHAVDTNQPDPTTLTAQLLWSSQGTPRNWSLSLRLQDAAGRHIVQVDPPDTHGYGYLPTTLWPSGEKVTDQVTLPLPEGLAPGVYTLRVITYLKVTGESGGELEVPVTLTGVTLREPGPALCEAGGLRLTALALPDAIQEGQPLDFEVTWNATAGNPKSLEAVWTLMAPDENEIARAAGPAAPGSDTATWPEKTWVRTFVHFDLPPTLPEGPYRLHLALVGQEQQLSACTLTTSLAVQLRERVFEIPDMPHAQVAIFDNFLQLLGYGVHHDATTLSLTVWWQATAVPPQDYKRFVHLFDPQTGALVAQDDAMPRDWTYPTSWWVEGEVVSETITLDLAAVPAGDYKLGVGWYDAAAGIPLPASDASGQSWPDDRVVLSGYRLQTR
ncbi:MAG: hypothetical protein JXB35_02980, partial [Anaerolineae bacterium]|nr:hypothetical protein [Anaerolineae bacterium]